MINRAISAIKGCFAVYPSKPVVFDLERLRGLETAQELIERVRIGFANNNTPVWEKLYRVSQYLETEQEKITKSILK